MELNGDLQGLIERAWALKDTIDGEINNSFWYCNFCSRHGHNCDIAGTAYKERERLSAIRDSLKDVESMLIYLQRLRSWQHLDRHAALARLEDSRSVLIENVSQYQGRPLDVVRELNACFGNGKMVFNKIKSRDQMAKRSNDPADLKRQKRPGLGFMVCCLKILLSPLKWHEAVGIAVKLAVVSASISSTVSFISCKKQKRSSRKGFVSLTDPTEGGKSGSLVGISKRPLHVLSGRG
ncbi:uncharacterized protein LOC115678019 [Syzygium oleosum]|uniref:uncharacterized protein LOC115678019 n=1 Tax=Syzygium oleosum TaxID=219896 RepID=UPI0011D1F2FD|nr:uncharacterized protein LOC115678019 [Syzygium oleosum]